MRQSGPSRCLVGAAGEEVGPVCHVENEEQNGKENRCEGLKSGLPHLTPLRCCGLLILQGKVRIQLVVVLNFLSFMLYSLFLSLKRCVRDLFF